MKPKKQDGEALWEVLEGILDDAGERLAEARAGLQALKLLTDHAGSDDDRSHAGNPPHHGGEGISGAEVRDGLRFLLDQVERHIVCTSARLDPMVVRQRVRGHEGGQR